MKTTPAANLGLRDQHRGALAFDDDAYCNSDECWCQDTGLPAREPPYTVDDACAEHTATIAALRAEVARLRREREDALAKVDDVRAECDTLRDTLGSSRRELSMLRAERSTLGRRAAVLEASEGGGSDV